MKTTFETTIQRISPKLRGICHRLNGHHTFFTDEDLVQEALVHLWGAFMKGAALKKTDSYLLQGCYFHLKNYLRTTLDKATLVSLDEPIDDETTLGEIIPAERSSFASPLDGAQAEEMIARRDLSEKERQVLSFTLEGLTTREIGARLGISHVMVVKIRAGIKKKYARYAR